MAQGGRCMRNIRHGYLRQQFQFLRQQYLQDGNLSLEAVLSEELVSEALNTIEVLEGPNLYTFDDALGVLAASD